MLSFFNRFKKEKIDFSVLGVDMHSHLIPGIDDGAKSIEDSIAFIHQLVNLGYQHIITTPHIMGEHYPNTREVILAGLEDVRAAVKKANIPVTIHAAAEYYMDEFFNDLLKKDEALLTLPNNHVLVELSTFSPPRNLFDFLFRLNVKGYSPILAHPERYVYYMDEFEIFEKIKSKGCLLQVNLLSLTGQYGPVQKKLADKLFKAGLVDFLGTDLHHQRHCERLQKALDKRVFQSYLEKYTFKNNTLLNPNQNSQ